MAFQKFKPCNAADLCRILCNLIGITVALIQYNLPYIFSEYLRQELQHVMLFRIQCLRIIAQDRHPALKQVLKDHILHKGVILHFINDQMFYIFLRALSKQSVFQIKDRKYIFVLNLPSLIWHIRKQLISVILQHPIIDRVDVFCHIHTVKPGFQKFSVIIGNITALQRLICINEILHDSIHS